MTRKTTDVPPSQTPEDRWYEASIKALNAEKLKHRDEALVYREDAARLKYERMERETWGRSRRTYDLATEVSEESSYKLINTLSDWTAESQEPVLLRLCSPGGDIVAGLAIYDFIIGLRAEGTRVDTLALGWAASMASVLLQCGEKRMVSANASVLIHEDQEYYETPWVEKITDAQDRIDFMWSLESRLDKILAERSVFTPEELREKYRRKNWWLTAQETVDLGFADEIWTPQRVG